MYKERMQMNKDYDEIKKAIFANFGIAVSFLQHRQEYRTNFAVEIIDIQTGHTLIFQKGNMDRSFGFYEGIVLVYSGLESKENHDAIERKFAGKQGEQK